MGQDLSCLHSHQQGIVGATPQSDHYLLFGYFNIDA